MKYIILIITLCSSTILFANPKINPVANNNNYLFVQLETLPIIDINITFNNGSFNDGDFKGLTNLMLNTVMSSNIDDKKIISYFENVGAKLSYSVGKESLSITIRTLNDIDQALVLTNIINKALRMDKLDSNILKLEKDKILRNIEDSKKRPATLLSSSISAAVTAPGPWRLNFNSVLSLLPIIRATPFRLSNISITSSITPSITSYSCKTPAISTSVIAHPGMEERRIRRNAFPKV